MKFIIFDNMAQCTETEVQQMLPLVSAQRREQALRYKHTFGRFCCLKSWLMLYVIDEMANYRDAEWKYNEHGKPYIEGGPYFSISHCKEGIAVAVDEKPVGIDIESIRKADKDLIERVMYAREQSMIANAADPDREFTRLWTQKEAIVKWRGTGIESFEQLQLLLLPSFDRDITKPRIIQTYEQEKYIYSIAYE